MTQAIFRAQQCPREALALVDGHQRNRPREYALAIDDEVRSQNNSGEHSEDAARQSGEKSKGPARYSGDVVVDLTHIDRLQERHAARLVGEFGQTSRPLRRHRASVVKDGRKSKNNKQRENRRQS